MLELPEKNKPRNFDGAVGNLTIETSLEKNEIASNENGNLRITISGAGNVSMIPMPDVQWPAGIESFGAKTNEELDKTTNPLKGVKTFHIPFTALAPGVYQIPAISFSYFDYKSKKYKSVLSDSLQVKVNNTLAAVVKPKQVAVITEGEGNFDSGLRWKLIGAFMFSAAAVIIFFIAGRSKKTVKKKPEPVVEEPVELKREAADFLSPAIFVKDGLDDKKFCSYLLNGVRDFMTDRLQIISSVKNNDLLNSALVNKGMKEEAFQLEQIVKTCEEAMFSPFELQINREQLIIDTTTLLKMVDEKQTA